MGAVAHANKFLLTPSGMKFGLCALLNQFSDPSFQARAVSSPHFPWGDLPSIFRRRFSPLQDAFYGAGLYHTFHLVTDHSAL
jgi:hypothetical protein